MKPFNLEAALAGATVVTRSGKKAIEVICFKSDISYPVTVILDNGEFASYTKTGANIRDGHETHLDLFMAPVEKEMFVNVYKSNQEFYYPVKRVYETKEEAERRITPLNNHIGTYSIKIVE